MNRKSAGRLSFKMIILDEGLTPIYHNQNASELYSEVIDPNLKSDQVALKPALKLQLKDALGSLEDAKQNQLVALKAFDSNKNRNARAYNIAYKHVFHFIIENPAKISAPVKNIKILN